MSQENANYSWIKRLTLANKISDATLPRSKKTVFRRGTVNSVGKGLAVSLLTKISDFEGMLKASRVGKLFRHGQAD